MTNPTSIFFFFFLLISSASAYPQAYQPLTGYLSNVFYNLNKTDGNLNNFDTYAISQKKLKKTANSLEEAISQTYANLKNNFSQSNQKLATDIQDARTVINNTIVQTTKDVKNNLSNDIDDKLNLNGGTLAGDLTVENNLTVEDIAYMEDVLPDSDDSYDLGSVSKGWNNLYISRLYGSSPIIIGGANSSHSLSSTDDLIISGDLEVNGATYFDDNIDLNSNKITNLNTPTDNTDAANKSYVDSQLGGVTYFQKVGSTLSPLDASDGFSVGSFAISSAGNLIGATGNISQWTNDSLYVITETDPIFLAHQAYNITASHITNLGNLSGVNTGDQNLSGYLLKSGTIGDISTRDHHLLSNLSDDDHSIYALLAGRSGGQTLVGGSGVTDVLTLKGTSGNGTLTSPAIQLNVGNNGATNAVTVLNNGNVGIGTPTPTNLFVVNSASNNATIDINAQTNLYSAVNLMGGGVVKFGFGKDPSNNFYITRLGASPLDFSILQSTGYIGLATTSPTNLLSLGGNAARTIWMERHTTADTAGNSLTLQSGGATVGATDKNGGDLYLASATATGTGSSNIYLQTATAGGAGTADRAVSTKVSILGNGNVGIGTTAPNQQLEITKNFRLPATTYNAGNQYGVIYKGANRFIHDFNYGDNGTVTTEGNNTFVGVFSGNFTMGSTATSPGESSYNTAIGNKSLNSITKSFATTAIGYSALYKNTEGQNNTAIGFQALYNNITAENNTAIGRDALFNNTGVGNNANGSYSLYRHHIPRLD